MLREPSSVNMLCAHQMREAARIPAWRAARQQASAACDTAADREQEGCMRQLIAVVVLLGGTACGKVSSDPEGADVDGAPGGDAGSLTVVSTTPASSASDVATDAVIAVVFSD